MPIYKRDSCNSQMKKEANLFGKGRLKMVKNDIVVYDVDISGNLKHLISVNKDITFDNPKLRDKIWGIPDGDLVRVGKSISSIKIVSVDVINDKFMKEIFK